MDKSKNNKLSILAWVQRISFVLIFVFIGLQGFFGFSFNLTSLAALMGAISWVCFRKRTELEYVWKLEDVNKKWSRLSRSNKRKYLYSKGIKKHIK